ncbi:hypothetical protein GCM10010357_57850 [Streptomyces luteireticuli]|uniref:Uncharacterized protein n=1 Tax=Streptomyces luteireticuli TaxID=173858 RepID=A0ABN0Z1H2_9ACTN
MSARPAQRTCEAGQFARPTGPGALAAVAAGGVTVVALMAAYGVLANEPILYGVSASLAACHGQRADPADGRRGPGRLAAAPGRLTAPRPDERHAPP